jgi:N-acetyl-gamma-glutamyl-phosphate reductase
MINVGIVGISGYSGVELLQILLHHPEVKVTYVSANNTKGYVTEIWPQLMGKTGLYCDTFNHEQAIKSCQLLFLAVPHTVAMTVTPGLLKADKRVIDLSGDYRLKDPESYQKWYGEKHKDPKNLSQAVYGLPEVFREKIKKAQLITNPGCYPTAALLGLAPLASIQTKMIKSIIIDAKSGVSGAGKKANNHLMFCEVNENFRAYKVLQHQHTPEIEQYLQHLAGKEFSIVFVPHLLPVNRGILETIYVQLKKPMPLRDLHALYKKFYKQEKFVRILEIGQQPELKNVNYSNYCDIGLALTNDETTLVITSAIDNLVKGAAGQAVQNMNILCQFPETEGLL